MAKAEEVKDVVTTDVMGGLSALGDFKKDHAEGFESVSAEDFKIPKFKIMQPTSPQVADELAKLGQFFNTVTNKAYDELIVNLLILGKQRAFFEKPYTAGSSPKCMSSDGVSKHDGSMYCKDCENSKWDDKKSPDCSLSYSWLGVHKDESGDLKPFRIICAGASFSPTKDFINSIAPKGYEPFVYNVKLTTKKEKGDAGVYFKLQYEILGIIKPDEYSALDSLQKEMKNIFETLKKQDVAGDSDISASAQEDTKDAIF